MSIVTYDTVKLVDSPLIKKMRYYGKHLPVPTNTDCDLMVIDHCLARGVRVVPLPVDVQRNRLSWIGFEKETYYPESMFKWTSESVDVPELWALCFKYFEQMQNMITYNFAEKLDQVRSQHIKNFFLDASANRRVCHEKHAFVFGIAHSDPTKISYMTFPKLSSICTHQQELIEYIHEVNFMTEICNAELRRRLCMMASPYKLFELHGFHHGNSEAEDLANILNMQNLAESYYIEIEDDVKKYMHVSSYSSEYEGHGGQYCGTLGAGCMRYDRSQPFLDIYQDNEHCKILVMKDQDGGIVARALLWQNVNVHRRVRTINIMDRVYTLRNAYEPLMIKWAKDNGYHYKKQQTYSSAILINPTTGKEMRGQVRIPVEWNDYEHLPYIDTYCHIYPELGFMSNSSRVRPESGSTPRHYARHTDGYYQSMNNYA
jgi:hypothetical protein